MSQQLATDFPIDPVSTSGTQLSDILNRWNQVINSTNLGATRPSTLTAGGLWVRATGTKLELMWYDGVTDQTISSVSTPGGSAEVGEDNSVAMALLFGA